MTSDPEPRPEGVSTLSTIRTAVGAVLLILLVVFVAINLQEVEIDFLIFSVQTPMLVAMLICALLGAAAALLFSGQGLLGIGRKKDRR